MSIHIKEKISDCISHPKEENGIALQQYVQNDQQPTAMNHSYNIPDSREDRESTYSRTYTSDSKYRWKKLEGNLDLFVMERNERHLTSLQWKWHKATKSRKRYSDKEESQQSDLKLDNCYSHTKSHIEEKDLKIESELHSKQRIEKNLETNFYKKWKVADERQVLKNKSFEKIQQKKLLSSEERKISKSEKAHQIKTTRDDPHKNRVSFHNYPEKSIGSKPENPFKQRKNSSRKSNKSLNNETSKPPPQSVIGSKKQKDFHQNISFKKSGEHFLNSNNLFRYQPDERHHFFQNSARFKYPREHISSYPRQQPNINYIYSPEFESKSHDFTHPQQIPEMMYQHYRPYLNSQHQGRFEYADPWLSKTKPTQYYDRHLVAGTPFYDFHHVRNRMTRDSMRRPRIVRALMDDIDPSVLMRAPQRAMTAKPATHYLGGPLYSRKPIFTYSNVAEMMSSSTESEDEFKDSFPSEVDSSEATDQKHNILKESIIKQPIKTKIKSSSSLGRNKSAMSSSSTRVKRNESIVFMIDGRKCYPGGSVDESFISSSLNENKVSVKNRIENNSKNQKSDKRSIGDIVDKDLFKTSSETSSLFSSSLAVQKRKSSKKRSLFKKSSKDLKQNLFKSGTSESQKLESVDKNRTNLLNKDSESSEEDVVFEEGLPEKLLINFDESSDDENEIHGNEEEVKEEKFLLKIKNLANEFQLPISKLSELFSQKFNKQQNMEPQKENVDEDADKNILDEKLNEEFEAVKKDLIDLEENKTFIISSTKNCSESLDKMLEANLNSLISSKKLKKEKNQIEILKESITQAPNLKESVDEIASKFDKNDSNEDKKNSETRVDVKNIISGGFEANDDVIQNRNSFEDKIENKKEVGERNDTSDLFTDAMKNRKEKSEEINLHLNKEEKTVETSAENKEVETRIVESFKAHCNKSIHLSAIKESNFKEENEVLPSQKGEAKPQKKQFEKCNLVRTTNRLIRQQNETEKQLYDMRQLLKVELDEQDDSCERDERTQERIDDLEKQIHSLDHKLEKINLEIQDSRMNSQQQSVGSLDSRGTYANTPLFIVGPHRGIMETIPYEEEDEEDENEEDFYNDQTSAYGTFDHVESALEETKIQQEELKHELQVQMMNLKAELEKQLATQISVAEPENDEVMNARVTNLEKQIEEMQKQIKQADEKIAETDLQKQKLRTKTTNKRSSHKPVAKSPSHASEKDSVHSKPQISASPVHKRLIAKTSSKVTPAPERKQATELAANSIKSCRTNGKNNKEIKERFEEINENARSEPTSSSNTKCDSIVKHLSQISIGKNNISSEEAKIISKNKKVEISEENKQKVNKQAENINLKNVEKSAKIKEAKITESLTDTKKDKNKKNEDQVKRCLKNNKVLELSENLLKLTSSKEEEKISKSSNESSSNRSENLLQNDESNKDEKEVNETIKNIKETNCAGLETSNHLSKKKSIKQSDDTSSWKSESGRRTEKLQSLESTLTEANQLSLQIENIREEKTNESITKKSTLDAESKSVKSEEQIQEDKNLDFVKITENSEEIEFENNCEDEVRSFADKPEDHSIKLPSKADFDEKLCDKNEAKNKSENKQIECLNEEVDEDQSTDLKVDSLQQNNSDVHIKEENKVSENISSSFNQDTELAKDTNNKNSELLITSFKKDRSFIVLMDDDDFNIEIEDSFSHHSNDLENMKTANSGYKQVDVTRNLDYNSDGSYVIDGKVTKWKGKSDDLGSNNIQYLPKKMNVLENESETNSPKKIEILSKPKRENLSKISSNFNKRLKNLSEPNKGNLNEKVNDKKVGFCENVKVKERAFKKLQESTSKDKYELLDKLKSLKQDIEKSKINNSLSFDFKQSDKSVTLQKQTNKKSKKLNMLKSKDISSDFSEKTNQQDEASSVEEVDLKEQPAKVEISSNTKQESSKWKLWFSKKSKPKVNHLVVSPQKIVENEKATNRKSNNSPRIFLEENKFEVQKKSKSLLSVFKSVTKSFSLNSKSSEGVKTNKVSPLTQETSDKKSNNCVERDIETTQENKRSKVANSASNSKCFSISTAKSKVKSEISSVNNKQKVSSISTSKTKHKVSTPISKSSRKNSKQSPITNEESKTHNSVSMPNSHKIISLSSHSQINQQEKLSTSDKSSLKENRLISEEGDEDDEEKENQLEDDISIIEEPECETSNNPTKRDFKAFFNFKGFAFKRKQRRKSILHGMGSKWCACPSFLWKYLGDESDEEIVTRRKCISLILGIILILLLLAIVISLVIGLRTEEEPPPKPTESPLQFTVLSADER